MTMDSIDNARLLEQQRLEALTECEVCGDDFNSRRIRNRRARGMNVCISCAEDGGQELDVEDLNDLSEEYWTGREASAGDGGYYSSEAMARAGRID